MSRACWHASSNCHPGCFRAGTKWNWALAVLTSILIHVGAAAAILWHAPSPGPRQAGISRIEISLAPPGGATVAQGVRLQNAEYVPLAGTAGPLKANAPSGIIEAVTPKEIRSAQSGSVLMDAPPAPAAQRTETLRPVDAPRPVERLKAEPRMPVGLIEPAQIEVLEAHAINSGVGSVATAKATRKPVMNIKAVQVKNITGSAGSVQGAKLPRTGPAMTSAVLTPSAAGNGSGSVIARQAGGGDGATGGVFTGATAGYLRLLQEWLERHKVYPRRARMRREEGTALLFFAINREGRLLEHRIEKSTGHRLLDREVERMLRRAEPLPKMPDAIRHARLELVVPVRFMLR